MNFLGERETVWEGWNMGPNFNQNMSFEAHLQSVIQLRLKPNTNIMHSRNYPHLDEQQQSPSNEMRSAPRPECCGNHEWKFNRIHQHKDKYQLGRQQITEVSCWKGIDDRSDAQRIISNGEGESEIQCINSGTAIPVETFGEEEDDDTVISCPIIGAQVSNRDLLVMFSLNLACIVRESTQTRH